ncbi:MAG: protein kinase domain-containing protein [Bradymonadia bacterium]
MGNNVCFAEAGDNDGGGSQTDDDLTGDVISGRFELKGLARSDLAGNTYSAVDTETDAQVWVFVAAAGFVQDGEAGEALEESVAKALEIEHESILSLIQVDQLDDGRTAIVSERTDGMSLAEHLETEGPLVPRVAVRLAGELFQALGAVHDADLVHQCLQPEFIYLQKDAMGVDRIRLGGLALANTFALDKASSRDEQICRARPEYLSPEAVAGKPLTEQTDYYNVGLVLYELLTGRKAFGGGDFRKTARQHAITRPLSPRIVRRQAQIPRALDAFVMKLLEKTAKRRFASLDDITAALETAAEEEQSGRGRTSLNLKPVASKAPSAQTAEASSPTETPQATEDTSTTQTEDSPAAATQQGSTESKESGADAEIPASQRIRPATEPLVSVSTQVETPPEAAASTETAPDDIGSNLDPLHGDGLKFKETGRWFVESVDELKATNPNMVAGFDDYDDFQIAKDRNIFPIIVGVLAVVIGGFIWLNSGDDEPDSKQATVQAQSKEKVAETSSKAAPEEKAAAKTARVDLGTAAQAKPDAALKDATAPAHDAAKADTKKAEQISQLREQALRALAANQLEGNPQALLETVGALRELDAESGYAGDFADKVHDALLLQVNRQIKEEKFTDAEETASFLTRLAPKLEQAHFMLKTVGKLKAKAESEKQRAVAAAEEKKRIAEEKAKKEQDEREKAAEEKKRIAEEKAKKEKEKAKKAADEKKRIAEERAKKEREERKKAAEEKKRKAADAKKLAEAKKRAEAVAKKQAEAEAKKRAEAKKKAAAKTQVVASSTADPMREGKRLLKAGRWAQAKTAFSKAVQQNGSNAAAHAGLGRVAFQQGQPKLAAKHYAKAVRLNGGNASYRVQLGLAFYKMGRLDRAKKHLEKALALQPGNRKAKKFIERINKKLAK